MSKKYMIALAVLLLLPLIMADTEDLNALWEEMPNPELEAALTENNEDIQPATTSEAPADTEDRQSGQDLQSNSTEEESDEQAWVQEERAPLSLTGAAVTESVASERGGVKTFSMTLADEHNKELLEITFKGMEGYLITNDAAEFDVGITADPAFAMIDKIFLIPSEESGAEKEYAVDCKQPICRHTFIIMHSLPGTYEYHLVASLEIHPETEGHDIRVPDDTISIVRQDSDLVITKTFSVRVVDEQKIREENKGTINYISLDSDKRLAVGKMLGLDDDYFINTHLERARVAEENLLIDKQVPVYEDGKSIYTIKVMPKENRRAKEVRVYEEISKNVAESASLITLDGMPIDEYNALLAEQYPGAYVQVLREDPLMVWHFAAVDQEIELTYEIEKKVHHDEIGNTFVTAEIGESTLRWRPFIFPIIVVCVVVPAIIFFARFQKKPKKTELDIRVEETTEKGRERFQVNAEKKEFSGSRIKKDQIIKLEFYIKSRLKKGHSKQDIKNDALSVNWPEELVEELFKRM